MSLRIVIIEPRAPSGALTLPEGGGATLLERTDVESAVASRLEALAPSVAIVDLREVGAGEIAMHLRRLREASPDTRLIAVTAPGDETAAQLALTSGAVAQVNRDCSPLALLRAANAAARGNMHLGGTGQRAIRRLLPTPGR